MISTLQKKYSLEYISTQENFRTDVVALFFGGTGLTAEKSYGNEIKQELENKNIRVIYISGPAAVLNKKLHGYLEEGLLGLLRFPKAFYDGKGRGGIAANVDRGLQILSELIQHHLLKRDATVLLEGWSRGAIAAQRLTHALLKQEATNALQINLRLEEPVVGGVPKKSFFDDQSTVIASSVFKYRLAYAIDDQMPHFHPILIYPRQTEEKIKQKNTKIDLTDIKHATKIYLPCTHIGMNWPALNSKARTYQLTVLLRKLDWNLELNEEEAKHLLDLFIILRGKALAQSLERINIRLKQLCRDLESKQKANVKTRLMYEVILGCLSLYREATQACIAFSPEQKKEMLENIRVIVDATKEIPYKLVSTASLLAYFKTLKPFLNRILKKP